MLVCPDCRGEGHVTLLYSRNPCRSCGGTGRKPSCKVETGPSTFQLDTSTAATGFTITDPSTAGDVTLQSAYGSGGDVVLVGGSTGTSGSAGSVTLTGGSGSIELGRSSAVEWAKERARELAELHKQDSYDRPAWQIGHAIPAVAPLSTAILADMVMMLEQEREEAEAIVCSCRDFADVLKFGDAPMLKWEGRSAVYFGAPILRSPDVASGYVLAVSKSRRGAVCTITR
jgi:hypothetical protein